MIELGNYSIKLIKNKINEEPLVEDVDSSVCAISHDMQDIYKIFIYDLTPFGMAWGHADTSIQRCLSFVNHIIAGEIKRNHGLDPIELITKKEFKVGWVYKNKYGDCILIFSKDKDEFSGEYRLYGLDLIEAEIVSFNLNGDFLRVDHDNEFYIDHKLDIDSGMIYKPD